MTVKLVIRQGSENLTIPKHIRFGTYLLHSEYDPTLFRIGISGTQTYKDGSLKGGSLYKRQKIHASARDPFSDNLADYNRPWSMLRSVAVEGLKLEHEVKFVSMIEHWEQMLVGEYFDVVFLDKSKSVFKANPDHQQKIIDRMTSLDEKFLANFGAYQDHLKLDISSSLIYKSDEAVIKPQSVSSTWEDLFA